MRTPSQDPEENGTSKQRQIETGLLNAGTEEQMEVRGYVRSPARSALTWVGVVLSLGLLRLVFHWVPQWYIYVSHLRCALHSADTVLVVENYQDKFKSYFVKSIKTLSVNNTFSGSTYNHDNTNSKNKNGTEESYSSTPSKLRIHLNNGTYRDVSQLRAIWVKKLCYIWDEGSYCFIRLAGLEQGFTSTDYHQSRGLSMQEQQSRHVAYGMNEMAVPVQSLTTLIFLELLNPFYFFQAFTVIVWGFEGYTYYPIAIIFMSIFGVASSVIQTRKSQRMLHGKVHASDIVTVWRGKDLYEEVPSSHLVPGDVIVIPTSGCQMVCDAVLISGQCVMNESMLTGESVPVCKTVLPSYPVNNITPHTMFCGTRVIQTRGQGNDRVCAVVMRTGFLTAKGNLVRSILYPPPADYKFENDTYKFIGILAAIATIGLIYTVVAKSTRGIAAFDVVIKALDIITIVIPPALPAAMTVGKLFAQIRLQAASIYCINSRVINLAGAINCVCFDKTGTLTEDGLDFSCIMGVKDNAFILPERESGHKMLADSPLVKGMATCHALTHIDGVLAGDPLDIKMFEASGWILGEEWENSMPTVMQPLYSLNVQESSFTENATGKDHLDGRVKIEVGMTNETQIDELLYDSHKNESTKANPSKHLEQNRITLMNQFPFESSLQRMSVVTTELNTKDTVVYCKGSPEMITSLSNQETVPLNFQSVLKGFTEQGFRVIAVGRRVFAEQSYEDVQTKSREDLEQDLEFLGLVVLENKLKVETTPVISVLKGANIRPIMVTGDNILTAISVAKECGIIGHDELVLEITATDGTDGKLPRYFFTSTKSPPVNCHSDAAGVDALCLSMDFKFAVTGTSWSVIRTEFVDLLPRLITRGAVFARMTSEQKQQLILHLQEYGYSVAMCGDGANDCAALKAASVGISLSDEESSVASPFTSKEPNISCVPLVIREGRASLTTAFGIFKFMILYSLVEFMSAIVLYSIDSNLADFQFLFIDICLIVHFAISFGRTKAFSGELSKETPTMRLFSTVPLLSITLQVIVMEIFQVASYLVLQVFPWFEPFNYDPVTGSYMCYENYTLFTLSLFQYIIMAIVFSKGAPYRQAIYTNYLLMFGLVLMTAVCAYITVYPALWVSNVLELMLPPTYDFRLIILAFGVLNFISSFFVETVIIEYIIAKKILPKLRNPKKSSKKYVRLESDLHTAI